MISTPHHLVSVNSRHRDNPGSFKGFRERAAEIVFTNAFYQSCLRDGEERLFVDAR
jgi:hypothetical protein